MSSNLSIRVSEMQRFFKKASKAPIASSSGSNNSREVNSAELIPPSDPALRQPILNYNPNERDRIRRIYLTNGPCQPCNHEFPQTYVGGAMRRFNPAWFTQYSTWLEYSIDQDAAFCLCCYLFRPENLGSGGNTNSVGEGFRNWKNAKTSFVDHVGDSKSWHNQSVRQCSNLMNQRQSIQAVVERQSVRQEMNYRIQLAATVFKF